MTSNILITFLLSLLTLSGINTSNTSQAITDTTVVNESAEVATGDTDYEEDDEVNDETDDEIADEDLMSIEEKYEHNKRNYSGDTLVWYDVPYCDNHDFEVLGDETETMYICKKCGYSYSEFHKNAESEDNTDSDEDENGSNEDADSDEDENGSNEEQESDDEDTCNE